MTIIFTGSHTILTEVTSISFDKEREVLHVEYGSGQKEEVFHVSMTDKAWAAIVSKVLSDGEDCTIVIQDREATDDDQ